jgi:hypothetical protein
MVQLSIGSEVAGYRIETVAGRGGMGVVYRAVDLALARPVALKLISDDLASDASFRERFKRESRLAASIRHPNVITVFHAGEEHGRLYIAMDYIEGSDLRQLIAGSTRLHPRLAAGLVSQVAEALDAAHAQTLVHRDVKPANILIAGEGEPYHAYLTDFGLTKYTGSDSAITQTGMVVGTIDYMAPEQIHGAPVDARADVYSLGCVLFEALTGRVPYPRESNVAKMFAHASEPPPSVTAAAPDLAPAFDAVVARAMAKDPAERYLSAGDLGRAALAAAAGTAPALAEQSVAAGEAAPHDAGATVPRRIEAAPTPPPRAPARRRSRLLIAAAAALLAAAAAAVVLLAGGDDGRDTAPRLSKDAYQDRVLDASRPFTQEAAKTEHLPAHVTRARDALRAARQLTALRTATDRYIRTLEQMRPPADIEGVHRRLVRLFKQIRTAIADAGAAADLGNDDVYRATPRRLDRAFQELENLAPEFESRGYRRLAL